MSWSCLCHHLEENGLGHTSLYHLNTTFSYNLWWIYRSTNSIWAKYMHSKYGDFNYFRAYAAPLFLTSHNWNCLTDILEEAEKHIGLLFEMEIPHSSEKNWIHKGSLISYALNNFSTLSQNLCIKDVIGTHGWNFFFTTL